MNSEKSGVIVTEIFEKVIIICLNTKSDITFITIGIIIITDCYRDSYRGLALYLSKGQIVIRREF